MSIKLGFYDFFAFTIPGSIYLIELFYVFKSFNVFKMEYISSNLSIGQILTVAIFSYVIGHIFYPLSTNFVSFFIRKEFSVQEYNKLVKRRSEISFNFKANDWVILLAKIRSDSIDQAVDIERLNALHIMLKNTSFAFILFSIIELIQLFIYKFIFLHLGFAIVSIYISIILIIQSNKYKRWFFSLIFQTIIARSSDYSDFVRENKEKKNKAKPKK